MEGIKRGEGRTVSVLDRSAGPHKRLFEMLLPLQPFTGFLSPITVRFQALHDQLDNDRAGLAGVWREFWLGNSSPSRRAAHRPAASGFGLMYNRGSVYTLLFQAVDVQVAQALSSLAARRYLRLMLDDDRGAYKRVEREFEEGSVVRRRPGLYAGYLAVKCAAYSTVYLVSHPLSILRTVVMTRGDVPLPAEGFWTNVVRYAGPRDALGLYRSSLAAHVASGLSEVVLTDIGLRSLRWALSDYLESQRHASGEDVRRQRRARRPSGEAAPQLPGTHQERLRAKLNGAAVVSALQMGVAFAVRTVLFPLFTVRARLEAQGGDEVIPVSALRYHGLIDCMQVIWESEGLAGFYRGFSAHMVAFAGNVLWISLIYGLTEAYIRLDVDFEDEDGI